MRLITGKKIALASTNQPTTNHSTNHQPATTKAPTTNHRPPKRAKKARASARKARAITLYAEKGGAPDYHGVTAPSVVGGALSSCRFYNNNN